MPRDTHRSAGTSARPGLLPPAPSSPSVRPVTPAVPEPVGTPAPSHLSPPKMPGRRRGRWLVLLSVLGPGVISAAAGNDAGGIATFSKVGANYGLSLLWGLALVTVGLIVVQEMCARMGAVTGKGLADLNPRGVWPQSRRVFALSVLVVANFAITVSEFAGIAAVGRNVCHLPRLVSPFRWQWRWCGCWCRAAPIKKWSASFWSLRWCSSRTL